MTRYAIGLGSNLGDRLQHLIEACDALSMRLGRLQVSSLYETEPVGGPEQDPFLNAVVVVDSDLDPLEVLDVCQEIETIHGRERKIRWGPRTLDIDIIASDRPSLASERLTVPHPRASEREFVLRPLAEIWPEAPVGHRLAAVGALDKVDDQGVDRLTNEWLPPVSRWKSHVFLAVQFGLFVAIAISLAYDGTLPDDEGSPMRVLGGAVAFIGVILAFVASRRLGPALAAPPIPRPGAELVTSGPYRFARHPIYGGITMFMVGTALVVDSVVGLAVSALLVPFFILKAQYEEKQLRIRYPGYLAYRHTVPRWLIPFVV